jgi:hypothetical protein
MVGGQPVKGALDQCGGARVTKNAFPGREPTTPNEP